MGEEEFKEVIIGCDSCYYTVDEHYTYVHDDEKDLCFSLPYSATEREVESSFRGYARGRVDGRAEGKQIQQRETREILGLK